MTQIARDSFSGTNMRCPVCRSKTQATFDGPQCWCRGCGRLFWINSDGSIRDTYVPKLAKKFEEEELIFRKIAEDES